MTDRKVALPPNGENDVPSALDLTSRSATHPAGMPRVLVIEDDEHVRSVLMAQLRREGIAAKSVGTGDAAVSLYTAPGLFDVVLLDMVMPGRAQGRDVARHIRGIDRNARIVLISGYVGAFSPGDCPEIDAVLTKPFVKADLIAHVRCARPSSQEGGVGAGVRS